MAITAILRAVTATLADDGTVFLESRVELVDDALGRLDSRVISIDEMPYRDAARAQILALAPPTESSLGLPLIVPAP